jgi:hypothetical protein
MKLPRPPTFKYPLGKVSLPHSDFGADRTWRKEIQQAQPPQTVSETTRTINEWINQSVHSWTLWVPSNPTTMELQQFNSGGKISSRQCDCTWLATSASK